MSDKPMVNSEQAVIPAAPSAAPSKAVVIGGEPTLSVGYATYLALAMIASKALGYEDLGLKEGEEG